MARSNARAIRATEVNRRLSELYPGSARDLCALTYRNPFELLVATILSAQCTDVRVNMVVPEVFARYPRPVDLAAARQEDLEAIIRSTGFFRSKAEHLIAMAQSLMERFGGEVPQTREELVTLSGVGRKTANVILSVAFGMPGLPVDTHVLRLSRLLDLTEARDAVKVESDLCALLPEKDWGSISLRLILHGRAVCIARRPKCDVCALADLCPSAFLSAKS